MSNESAEENSSSSRDLLGIVEMNCTRMMYDEEWSRYERPEDLGNLILSYAPLLLHPTEHRWTVYRTQSMPTNEMLSDIRSVGSWILPVGGIRT
jgi:hypothetical protein